MCSHADTLRFSRRASGYHVVKGEERKASGFDPLSHINVFPMTGITIKKGWGSALWHIHLPTILLCTRVIRSTNTCTPAFTMIPQTSQSAPVTSGQIVSALSMPLARRLVAFWVVTTLPGKWSHNSQHGQTNLLSLSSHTPFSIHH